MFKNAFIFALLTSTAAFATTAAQPSQQLPLEKLNQAIAQVLGPINNQTTKASAIVKALETNSVKTLTFDMALNYFKSGTKGLFNLKVDEISYDYSKQVDPTARLNANLDADLTVFVSQEDLNTSFADLEGAIRSYAADQIDAYGEAFSMNLKNIKQVTSATGDFESAEGELEIAVDLSKLPSSKKPVDEPVTKVLLKFKVAAKTGVAIDGTVVLNPTYSGFAQDRSGLKDYLDRLIAQDKDTLDEFASLIQLIDNGVSSSLN